MRAFTTLTGVAAVIPGKNIDTDQIIPARFLKLARGQGLDKALFHDLRFTENGQEKEFVLNQPPFDRAEILIVDQNFGCGSSREAAVYALDEFGIRVIIGPEFGDIFHNNCLKNGILPIVLSEKQCDELTQMLSKHTEPLITVSLKEQLVCSELMEKPLSFQIDAFWKTCLLKGIDDLTLTLSMMDQIEKFERDYGEQFPWQKITQ